MSNQSLLTMLFLIFFSVSCIILFPTLEFPDPLQRFDYLKNDFFFGNLISDHFYNFKICVRKGSIIFIKWTECNQKDFSYFNLLIVYQLYFFLLLNT